VIGSECVLTCDEAFTCNSNGRCNQTDGTCLCYPGYSGRACDVCDTGGYGTPCSNASFCDSDITCNASGRCKPDATCECFPKFNCSAVVYDIASAIPANDFQGALAAACPESYVNTCLRGCSGDHLDVCQADFVACAELSQSGVKSTCECMGRLRACTMDAGCYDINSMLFKEMCAVLNCTDSQCQANYPGPTMCDWDAHSTCEDTLEVCLAQPEATLSANDTYYEEQAKYAARCSCYNLTYETFIDPTDYSCGNFSVSYTRLDGVFVTDLASTWVREYNSESCMSRCMNESEAEARARLVAFDCAVCGDGEIMPGREACDDGNRADLDGCSSQCTIETPEAVEVSVFQSGYHTVTVEWEHTNLTLQAAEENLLHQVLGYWMVLNTTRCSAGACSTVLEEHWFDYTQNCSNTSCSFVRGGIFAGDYAYATVYAINVAGKAPNVTSGLRFVVVPTSDMIVLYDDPLNASNVPQALLTWYPPSETGYGDNVTVLIDSYRLEIASCPLFEGDENASSCLILDTIVLPDDGENNTSETEFLYPFTYAVTADLIEGYPYWYRITPQNFWGSANSSFSMQQDFETITVVPPILDAFPAELPLPVAIADENTLHIWQGDTYDVSVQLLITGFPEIRKESSLLTTFTLGNWTGPMAAAFVLFSNVAQGTLIGFIPPTPPPAVIHSCISTACDAVGTFQVENMPSKIVSFGVRYFKYPDIAVQFVSPSMGSITGGNVMRITMSDFFGPRTREGAGLPNLDGVALGTMTADIWFVLDGNRINATSITVDPALSSSAVDTGMRDYLATVTVPESPTMTDGLARLEVFIDGIEMNMNEARAKLLFQYVGSQMLYITPASGMLNPGSGGLVLTVVMANVPDSEISITVADIPCEILGRVRTQTPIGTQTALDCQAPELDTSYAPLVNVSAYVEDTDTQYEMMWQYLLPPAPVVDTETMIVEGITQPWIPSGNWLYPVTITIRNVAPRYGIDPVSALFVFTGDNGKKANVSASFVQVGLDLRCTFASPNTIVEGGFGSPAVRNVSAEICHTRGCVSVDFTKEGVQWTVEFIDTSVPALTSLSPDYGPATGRALLFMGISGTQGNVLRGEVTVTVGGVPATTYGVVSVSDWNNRGPGYARLLSIQAVSSKVSSMSEEAASQIDEVVSATYRQALRSLDPTSAGLRTGIVVAQTPPYTGNFSNGFGAPREVSVRVRIPPSEIEEGYDVSLTSTFSYTEPPPGPALATGVTENGDTRSGLDGGIRLTITVRGFSIIYSAAEIVVEFKFTAGVKRADVTRLRYSTFFETKFDVIVPAPFRAEQVVVEVYPLFRTFVRGSFAFTYFDDRMPAILRSEPFIHYSLGGSEMSCIVTRLEGVPLSMIQVDFQSSNGVVKSVIPTQIQSAPSEGERAVNLTFRTPTPPWGTNTLGPVGDVQFFVRDLSDQKRSAAALIQMIAIPTTPPTVVSFSPSQAVNDGSTLMRVRLQNMLMVSSVESLNIQIDLGTRVLQVLPTTPNSGVTVSSTMTQTDLTFVVPDTTGAGLATVRLWVTGREAQNATFSLFVQDVKSASISYVFPSTGKASISTLVDVQILRFATATISDRLVEITASQVVLSTPASSLASAKLVSLRVLSDQSTVLLRINMERTNGDTSAGLVNVTVKSCPGICPTRTVQFPFSFRSPSAPFILFYSPSQTFTDGRVPLNLTMENLDAFVNASHVSILLGNANATNVEINRYDPRNPSIAVITALIPTANSPGSVLPQLVIESTVTTVLPFPSALQYIQAPMPAITDVNPRTADVTTQSRVIVIVRRFPGVVANSDVIVEVSSISAPSDCLFVALFTRAMYIALAVACAALCSL
jgi:cysteine-rich repeat protein